MVYTWPCTLVSTHNKQRLSFRLQHYVTGITNVAYTNSYRGEYVDTLDTISLLFFLTAIYPAIICPMKILPRNKWYKHRCIYHYIHMMQLASFCREIYHFDLKGEHVLPPDVPTMSIKVSEICECIKNWTNVQTFHESFHSSYLST